MSFVSGSVVPTFCKACAVFWASAVGIFNTLVRVDHNKVVASRRLRPVTSRENCNFDEKGGQVQDDDQGSAKTRGEKARPRDEARVG